MKKDKYYILKRGTPDKLGWMLREFCGSKQLVLEKRFKMNANAEYLLIEKTCNPDHTESVTDIFPIHNESELLKKIGKKLCYDYTGIAQLIVWENRNFESGQTYLERKEKEKGKLLVAKYENSKRQGAKA
jgi:hypothetical protein